MYLISGSRIAGYSVGVFEKLGIPARTQQYSFDTIDGVRPLHIETTTHPDPCSEDNKWHQCVRSAGVAARFRDGSHTPQCVLVKYGGRGRRDSEPKRGCYCPCACRILEKYVTGYDIWDVTLTSQRRVFVVG